MPARRTHAVLNTLLSATAAMALAGLAQAQTAAPTAAPDSAASAPAGLCATVEIENLRPGQGQVMVAAYGSAETFGKRPLKAIRVPAGEARMSVQLCGLSGTEVALMLFQDLDSDGKMGRNLMGMPTEPWGSSGQPSMFGPQWDTGKVALDGRPIAVKMSM
jgi:uncharacterized protein (DUF2141 family)